MERSYPELFLLGFGIVITVILLVAATFSTSAFGAYNPTWEGTSDIRSLAEKTQVETEIVRETGYYQDAEPNGTLAFIISPATPYSSTETSILRNFTERGGTLVIAGDFGPTANELLRNVGVSTRLDGELLRDEQRYDRAPTLPRATNVTNHTYTDGVNQLTLNYGTALNITAANVTTLVQTSPYAYRDTTRNNQLDDNETLAHYPVVAVESVGQGHVVVVGDPSIFINAMIDRAGNRRFVTNLLTSHERMALDLSHAGGIPPVIGIVLTLRESALLQLLAGTFLVMILVRHQWINNRLRSVWARFVADARDPPSFSREEIIESLQERYPDWDDERTERVAQSLMDREENSHHND